MAARRRNKMMIMQAIFKEFDASDLMYPAGQEPDTPFKRSIAEFKELMRVRLQEQQINLCLPGRIIHLAKVSKGRQCSVFPGAARADCFFSRGALGTKACCTSSVRYRMREAECEDFEEILMSTTMGADHLPDVYYYEIKKLLNERMSHITV